MSEEIKNIVGFDCSAAINELLRLDQQLQQNNKTLLQFGNALKGVSTSNPAKQTQQLNQQLSQAVQSTQGFTVSWQTLTRVVQTQLIVRTMSQIRALLQSSLSDSIKFEQAVGRALTVADGATFNELASAARNLSDEFNVSLISSIEGLNQAIQNGIGDQGKLAEAVKFTAEATKFARVTNSSVADSVDLLSAAVKTYGLTAAETDKVASAFFVAIDKGRINASELANSFGRVGQAGKNIGLALNETPALLAAITRNGLGTAEAMTQLRAIITAFEAPSPKLTEAIHDMGFASADLAIQSKGALGVLKSLAAFAKGNPEVLAQMFRNVRGRGGVLNLANEEFESLIENLKAIDEAGRNLNTAKFLQATNNEAEKLSSSINQLKNAFTVGLAPSVIKTINDILDFTGVMGTATDTISHAGPAVVGLTGSMTLYAAGLTAVGGPMGALIGSIPALIGLMTSLNQQFEDNRFNDLQAPLKALENQNKKAIDALQAQLSAEREIQRKSFDDTVKLFADATKNFDADYQRRLSIAQSTNTAIVSNTKSSSDAIVNSVESIRKAYENAIDSALNFKRASDQRQLGIKDKIDELQFEQQIRQFNTAQKIFALTKRGADQASDAARALSSAGQDQDKLNRAFVQFDIAQKSAEEALSLAKQTGDKSAELKASKQLQDFLNFRIQAENDATKAQQRSVSGLQKQVDGYDELIVRAKILKQQLEDNADINFQDGKQLSDAEKARRKGLRDSAAKELQTLTGKIKPQDISRLGLGEAFAAELSRNIQRLKAGIDSKQVQDDLNKAFATYRLNIKTKLDIDVKELERLTNTLFSNPDEIKRELVDQADKLSKTQQQLDEINALEEQRLNTLKEIGKQNELINIPQAAAVDNNLSLDFNPHRSENIAFNEQKLTELRNDILKAASQAVIAPEQLEQLRLKAKAIFETINQESGGARSPFKTAIQQLDNLFGKLQQLQKLPATNPQQKAQLETQLKQQQQIQQALLTKGTTVQPLIDAGQKLLNGASALGQAVIPSATIRDNALSAGQALLDGANAWIRASQAQFSAPAAAVNREFGGVDFFAAGGRGTDRIAAFLSPGETVVDSRNSRKFFSELQAIRAGFSPRQLAAGGSVDNSTRVGDIVIHAHKGTDVEAFGTAINRAIRRGNLKIRGN